MKIAIIFLISLSFLSASLAEDGALPRGADIGTAAGNCSIGPFGQTGDVGEYHGFCHQLTVAERCFAFYKQHIDQEGNVEPAYDSAKAVFCSKYTVDRITGGRR